MNSSNSEYIYGGLSKPLIFIFFSIFFLGSYTSSAQDGVAKITSRFEEYHTERAIEKVYLQTSRERFTIGDTLYLGAYVLNGSDHTPSFISGVLYVELISPKDSIINTLKLNIDDLGRTFGDFALSDSLNAGQYSLRAYTQYQMNFDHDYIFTKSIKLLPRLPVQELVEQSPNKVPQVKLQFFPEGGELVAGAANVIAYKATDQYGNPLDITGDIFDDSGKKITSIYCVHDGMGVVQIKLEEGKKYNCIYQFAGTSFSQPLPNILSSGYLLNVRRSGGRWQAFVNPINTSVERSFIVIQCRGEILYVVGPQPGSETIKFSLEETELPQGIIQVTYFDPQHRAVAERLFYNENPNSEKILEISTDEQSYGRRSEVNLDYSLTGNDGETPELATLSTTVIPEKLRVEPSKTISSFLLFTSDLKGYVHQPTYYLDRNNKDRLRHMDLLMMTHGWRRFDWNELMDGPPELEYFFEQGIRIEGTVTSYLDRSNPMVKDVSLSFPDNPDFELEAKSMENGLFWFDRLKFNDTLTAIVKTIPENVRKSKKKSVENNTFIQVHERTIPGIPEDYRLPYRITPTDEVLIERGKRLFDISMAFDQSGVVAEESIKESDNTRRRDPLRNRQGMIYDTPDHRIMLDSFPHYYRDIFQYLYGVPGLTITGFSPNVSAKIRGAESFNSPTTPLYLLDGLERTERFVNNINVMNILFIDVLKGPNANIYGSRGATGVIAIYSREAGEMRAVKDEDMLGKAVIRLAGYTPARDFYMPDYDEELGNENMRPDFRSTIHWNPSLIVQEGQASDQFYTSDETGKFIIYSEGVTVDGKIFSGSTTYTVE